MRNKVGCEEASSVKREGERGSEKGGEVGFGEGWLASGRGGRGILVAAVRVDLPSLWQVSGECVPWWWWR